MFLRLLITLNDSFQSLLSRTQSRRLVRIPWSRPVRKNGRRPVAMVSRIKRLSLVGSQRNVAFATNAFLPVFGVDGDAAVTCREGLIYLDVEFTAFHELFDLGDTRGVLFLFLFTHREEAGKRSIPIGMIVFSVFMFLLFFVNINVILIYSKSCTTSHNSLNGFTI